MAQQAVWIRQNMFTGQNSSPSKSNTVNRQNNNRRVLTDAELKVQRSLEKLSIPAWYLNNSSSPPKILKHNTPIDTRLPTWRTGTYKSKNVSSSPILNHRKLSGTPSPRKTPKANRNTEDKKIPRIINDVDAWNIAKVNRDTEESNIPRIINRLDTWNIPSPGKTPIKYTQSYPKISPSRKIQNINIVFPPSSKIQLDNISINNDKDKSELIMDNSLYESSLDEYKQKSVRVTDIDKLLESSMEQSYNINKSIDNQECETRDIISTELIREKVKITSIDKYSPVSLSSIIGNNKSNIDNISTVMPLKLSEYNDELSDNCETCCINHHTNSNIRYLPGSMNFKSRSKLMPINEDKEIIERKRSLISNNKFMTTTKKSTALEQIVKDKMTGGTGLIQDIIHEFQKKCVKTANPTFTQGSKKFVKKLVKVLEKSIHEDHDESQHLNEDVNHIPYDISLLNDIDNINDNNYDRKSVTSSPTISIKCSDGTGSGRSETPSPTSLSSIDYDWSMQVQVNTKNNINKKSKNNCNNVQWIPLSSNAILPRTSSALSVKSRSSSKLSNKSLCISPITHDNEQQHFFGNNNDYWSWSYGRNNTKTRRLLGRETSNAIFDSGYVEKSEHSFMIQSFLAEYEASQLSNDLDTSASRRLSHSRASSIFSRPIHV